MPLTIKSLLQVILLHARSDSKEAVRDIPFLIDVDNTLEDILIVLSAEDDPAITLFNPTGKISPGSAITFDAVSLINVFYRFYALKHRSYQL